MFFHHNKTPGHNIIHPETGVGGGGWGGVLDEKIYCLRCELKGFFFFNIESVNKWSEFDMH